MVEVMQHQLRAIDYDRGVMIRQDGKSGIEVYMYIDDPGIYLSVHGNKISEDLARSAGYPVDAQLKARQFKLKLADFEAKLKTELQVEEAGAQTLREHLGFKLIELGPDRCQIISPQGIVLNTQVLPKDEAVKLFDEVTGSNE